MTQHDDAQLATWLAEGPAHAQPASLERALGAARATRQRPAWLVAATGGTISAERTNRSVGLAWGVVAVVALIGLLIGGLVVGGWLRLQPKPDSVIPSATAIAQPSGSEASPQALVTASPEAALLGGGPILVYQPHEPRGPCEDFGSHAPFDLFSLDAGTGTQTLLGTTAEDCSAIWLNLQMSPDQEHILITDELGQETLDLGAPTAAAGDLSFICCGLPTDVWEGGGAAFDGWLLSPAGDRVAAIHTATIQVPGMDGGIGAGDAIVVANVDGTGLTTLPLPEGAAIRGWATWSPDESALVVAACLPCNHAIETSQPATAENHDHLYVVPVDGSPVRELLDDTEGWFWTPVWSPDGSTFATVRRECLAQEAPPQCSGETRSSLMLLAAGGGSAQVLATNEQLGEGFNEFGPPLWSPDAGSIAFDVFPAVEGEPHGFVIDADGENLVDLGEGSPIQWSPDGEWILISRSAQGAQFGTFIDLWIMRADGSEARSLGTFLKSFFAAAAW